MPHPVCEPAGYAIAQMAEVLKHGDNFIDSAAERRAVSEKLCLDSEAKLHRAEETLKPLRAELARVEAELKQANRLLDDRRTRANLEIEDLIARAQGEEAALLARIEKAKREIVAINASTESLIKRLHIA
jgi:chromosome segregation ATPase